jgi:type II secretory pathway component PulM
MDLVASTQPDFGPKGWEPAEDYSKAAKPRLGEDPQAGGAAAPKPKQQAQALAEDIERSMRRARAKVRRIALSNEFRWFVTLTLDPAKVDSCDGAAVV